MRAGCGTKAAYEAYLDLLADAFNPGTVEGLMCRNTINVSWQGEVFDCDFNQMLKLPLAGNGRRYLWELDSLALAESADRHGGALFRLHRGRRLELRRRFDLKPA